MSTEGCGFASSAVGPFYCPGDSKVYLDLGFFDELRDRFQRPRRVRRGLRDRPRDRPPRSEPARRQPQGPTSAAAASTRGANELSVRVELQADFYAGVWAHHAQKMKNILEPGDLESALKAATAIGDDRLQKEAQGYVVPDSFTHGTSQQRVRWFRRGFETGDVNQGNTFEAEDLYRSVFLARLGGSSQALFLSPEAIEGDRRDDDGADDHVLGGVRDAGVDAAVVQHRHDQAADQRPEHGPLAAAEAAAADDDRRDDLELQAVGGDRVAGGVEVDELHHPARPVARPAERVDRDLDRATLIPQSRAVASFEPMA